MKKLLTSIVSFAVLSASLVSFSASADDTYIPLLYMNVRQSEGVTADADGNITISREDLEKNNYTLTTDVFIQDESVSCWFVSVKWKSADKYIKLQNLVDPMPMEDGKENIPYAYAETDDDGSLTSILYTTITSTDEELNTMGFTCSSRGQAMVPYGEKSDSYPLTSFDINFNKYTPAGEYSVYFLTKKEDDEDQQLCQLAVKTENGSTVIKPPAYEMRTRTLKITLTGDLPKDDIPDDLGDVNGDGNIDASDATDVLSAYAALSTSKKPDLTDAQLKLADVNFDGGTDASDASIILAYYAHVSTTENPLSFKAFIQK